MVVKDSEKCDCCHELETNSHHFWQLFGFNKPFSSSPTQKKEKNAKLDNQCDISLFLGAPFELEQSASSRIIFP